LRLTDEEMEQYWPVLKRLAAIVARRAPRSITLDDLVGEGALALVRCSRRFDASRGVPFLGFALLNIRGAMISLVRRTYRDELHADLTEGIALYDMRLDEAIDAAARLERIEAEAIAAMPMERARRSPRVAGADWTARRVRNEIALMRQAQGDGR
jgi:DNA-directed RNA polymerase specialized sigma subunit